MRFCNLAAIVVTYNPDVSLFSKLLLTISPQVKCIYVIDNGSIEPISVSIVKNIKLITLEENKGISFAQNIGIIRAFDDDCDDIILFDQDSIPEESMLQELHRAREGAQSSGFKVAAVGPVHRDQDTQVDSCFIVADKRVKKIFPFDHRKRGVSFSSCSFLIASGCLISKEAINSIGFMDESLFIDCVDIEWGFRATSKGWNCIGAFDASMSHKIGGKPLQIFGRSLTTHSPLRHYYFYRNFYSLLKRRYIPLSWKIHTLVKSTIQALIFCFFLEPRIDHFQHIVRGAYHGVKGKGGKHE